MGALGTLPLFENKPMSVVVCSRFFRGSLRSASGGRCSNRVVGAGLVTQWGWSHCLLSMSNAGKRCAATGALGCDLSCGSEQQSRIEATKSFLRAGSQQKHWHCWRQRVKNKVGSIHGWNDFGPHCSLARGPLGISRAKLGRRVRGKVGLFRAVSRPRSELRGPVPRASNGCPGKLEERIPTGTNLTTRLSPSHTCLTYVP